jgi:GNAT superfamily N-acetyltransferase
VWGISLLIEPLTRDHDRKSFDCGDETVTRFLREKAMQDQELELSRSMVLVDSSGSKRIIGFHTLLMTHVMQAEIPNDRPKIKRGIPVILLGQLGVDVEYQGRGLGEILLMDVQARVDEISRKIGIRALMLDARSEELAAWYERYDFVRFPRSMRMFKSIEAIRELKLV